MSISIVALALAYVFLLFLVLLAIFRSEVGSGLKLVLAALCLGFYLWHYSALQQYLGWPAAQALPARFALVSSFIIEPDLKQDEAGGIYLWVRDLDSETAVPRAYRLPYQKALHRKVDDTMRKQQQGERFVGSPVSGGGQRQTRIEFEAVQRDTQSHKSVQ
ncbi:MAG: hypothetical protein EP300_06825 [Gammaproteobacteria bacterium]|nr:MAG: hypothetical protein EP300_06825 [Gammaproteobacteria bacterium]